MFGATVQEDISLVATDWGWGYNNQVANDGDLLVTTLTGEWGAVSTGWGDLKDLSGWDKIIILVENMSGCDGDWFKLKAYLRDNTESEANQMEGLLGKDAPDNEQNYLVIDLHQDKACDLTAAKILAIQCQPNGASFNISRVYLEKEVYVVEFALGDAEGTAPATLDVTVGEGIAMPVNKTMYKAGYTLTGWSDGVNTYPIGQSFTPANDVVLTPVFTANEADLLNASSDVTVKWYFGGDNGAPTTSYEGNSGLLVAQATIGDKTVDVKLAIDATSGKFAPQSDTEWAQVVVGTIFTYPYKAGITVNVGNYKSNVTYYIADAEGKVVCYYENDYYSFIEVTYPASAPTPAPMDEQDLSIIASNWSWGWSSSAEDVEGGLKGTINDGWGAISTSFVPPIDLTDWDKLVIVVENIEGCDGQWWFMKAVLRDSSFESEEASPQLSFVLGKDHNPAETNYLVIDLNQEVEGFDITAVKVLAIQSEVTGSFTISRVFLAKEEEQVPTNADPVNPSYHYSTFFHSTQNYKLTNDGTQAFIAENCCCSALHRPRNAVELCRLTAVPKGVQAVTVALEFLWNHGVATARAGKAGGFGQRAQFNRTFSRAVYGENRTRAAVSDKRFISRIVEDHRVVLQRVFYPRF